MGRRETEVLRTLETEAVIGWGKFVPLLEEYLLFWSWSWLKNSHRFPKIAANTLRGISCAENTGNCDGRNASR